MKKVLLIVVIVAMAAGLAFAQLPAPDQTKDVLGAHLVYGRGCAACHVPHSGPFGNGGTTSLQDGSAGNIALWGQDMAPLYGQTLTFGDGTSFTVTLPNTSNTTIGTAPNTIAPVAGATHSTPGWSTMACLSCHDGNIAKSAFMAGTTVETVKIGATSFNPPTLLGHDGGGDGNYHNDHPIGPNAEVGCGTWDWDCSFNSGTAAYTIGANQTVFASNYMNPISGIMRNLVKGGGTTGNYVQCTTCHDQHSMNAYKATIGNGGTATTQYVKTTFFLRGYYDPSTGGNNTAQFCRQCHGGEANEMHGVMAVPTT